MEDIALEKLVQLKKDYHEVFSSEAGKRVLEDLKKAGFFYQTTIHSDTNQLCFQEGQRALVLHITSRMELKNIIQAAQQNEVENDNGQSNPPV